jgi:diguanylate cyclase
VDPLLVYTVSAVAMSTMAVLYFVGRMRMPSAQTGRWWGLAFLSGVLCATAYFIGQRTDDAWWTVAVGNATMVFTVGAAWMGCLGFNARRPPRPVLGAVLVLGLSLAVGVLSALPSEDGSKYAGAAAKGIALVVLSILALVECLRRPLRGYAGAWVIAAVFAAHALYLVPRSLVFLTLGPHSPLFSTVFSTAVTTAMNIVFTVAVEASILAIQVEHRRRLPTGSGYRRYPDRAPREQAARPLEGTLVVMGVDLWDPLRRAYGADLAQGLSLELAQAIATAQEGEEDDGTSGFWRLPDGRFALRRTSAASARATIGGVRAAFRRRAALPEGRPSLSAVILEAPPGAGITEGDALTAARAVFHRRGATEIEWIEVVASPGVSEPEQPGWRAAPRTRAWR